MGLESTPSVKDAAKEGMAAAADKSLHTHARYLPSRNRSPRIDDDGGESSSLELRARPVPSVLSLDEANSSSESLVLSCDVHHASALLRRAKGALYDACAAQHKVHRQSTMHEFFGCKFMFVALEISNIY